MIGLIQRHLEAIYAIEAPDIHDFLVDAATVREVLGDAARPAREWVLVRQTDEDVDIAVYFHEDDVRDVDGRTPGHRRPARGAARVLPAPGAHADGDVAPGGMRR